jgi:nicotinamidase-related amidase
VPVSQQLVDRDDLVLVTIDEQERLASAMSRRDAVIAATERLVRVTALVGAPIIATRQYPKGLGDTEPAVLDTLDQVERAGTRVVRVDKTAFCCGAEPAFLEALESLGRGQVVIAGMETHICVTQTALDLVARGFRVHVAADAVCSRADSDHETALARMRDAGTVVSVSESVMYEAVGRAATDEFRELLAIVKGT